MKETVMQTNIIQEHVSKPRLWAGKIISGLLVAFLIFDGVTKVIQTDAVVKGSEQLGLPAATTPVIGFVLLICTAIYVFPATRILGAILLTGYLGGAIAMHVRAGNGAFPIIFSAVYGVLIWVGLVLLEPRLFGLIVQRQLPRNAQLPLPVFEE